MFWPDVAKDVAKSATVAFSAAGDRAAAVVSCNSAELGCLMVTEQGQVCDFGLRSHMTQHTTHTRTHTDTDTHTHARTHARTHALTYAHTYTHTHIHTRTLSVSLLHDMRRCFTCRFGIPTDVRGCSVHQCHRVIVVCSVGVDASSLEGRTQVMHSEQSPQERRTAWALRTRLR